MNRIINLLIQKEDRESIENPLFHQLNTIFNFLVRFVLSKKDYSEFCEKRREREPYNLLFHPILHFRYQKEKIKVKKILALEGYENINQVKKFINIFRYSIN